MFSQIKDAILHASHVLDREGIRHARVVKGDPPHAQHEAVRTFNEAAASDCGVFLLHAGQAAAGLTLTVARRVVLLEPFLKAGEEQQALNRCHRIGQTRPVLCTTLYCGGTVEERMLVRV